MTTELERLQALPLSGGALMDPDFLRRVVAETTADPSVVHAHERPPRAAHPWRPYALGLAWVTSVGSVVAALLTRHQPPT